MSGSTRTRRRGGYGCYESDYLFQRLEEKGSENRMRTVVVGFLLVVVSGVLCLMQIGWPDAGDQIGTDPVSAGPVAGVERPEARAAIPCVSNARAEVKGESQPAAGLGQTCTVLVSTDGRFPGKRERAVSGVGIDIHVARVGLPGLEKVGAGITDEEGLVLVCIPMDWMPTDHAEGVRIAATVCEPGYQSLVGSALVPSDKVPTPEDPLVVRVLLREGCTVRGTLMDPMGRPTGGRVSARRKRGDGGWEVAEDALANPLSGCFALQLRKRGFWQFSAVSYQPGHSKGGTVVSPIIEVDPENPPQDVTLRLIGSGVVQGRVLDRDGQPAAGLELRVATAKLEGLVGRGVPPLTERNGPAGRGHHLLHTVTDDEGGFRFSGLRSDLYVIRARLGAKAERGYPYLLTPNSVPSDGSPLDLHLDQVQRSVVIVRVRDALGSAVTDIGLLGGSEFHGWLGGWRASPWVMVVPASDSAIDSSLDDIALAGRRMGSGEVLFEAPGRGEFHVVLMAPGAPVLSRRVGIAEDDGRVEVVMDMPPPGPTGKLSLVVEDPRGTKLERDVGIRVLDPDTGIYLYERRDLPAFFPKRTWPFQVDLPIGEYRVEVVSLPCAGYPHRDLSRRRAWGDYQTNVLVAAGASIAVTARLGEAGYLELTLVGSANEDDRRVVSRGPPRRGVRRNWSAWSGKAEEQVSAVLRRENAYPIPLRFVRVLRKDANNEEVLDLCGTLKLGLTQRSEALPTGSFVLEARLPGGRVVSQDVVIIAGATIPVELDFGES